MLYHKLFCKTIDNKRALAAEILVNNNAIANDIREAAASQVYSNPNRGKIWDADSEQCYQNLCAYYY